MGIEKSEIKKAVAHELGAGFNDALEAAKADINRWDGAKVALKGAAKDVEGLLEHIQKDLKEDESINEEQAMTAKLYVRRAAEVVRNLSLRAEVFEQRAQGRAEAMGTAVKITKKLYDAEDAKLKALQSQLVDDDDKDPPTRRNKPRPVGARPPNRIAALKAAEQDSKADGKDETTKQVDVPSTGSKPKHKKSGKKKVTRKEKTE